MNGAKLRERLSKGEAITMFNPHHVSPGLSKMHWGYLWRTQSKCIKLACRD